MTHVSLFLSSLSFSGIVFFLLCDDDEYDECYTVLLALFPCRCCYYITIDIITTIGITATAAAAATVITLVGRTLLRLGVVVWCCMLSESEGLVCDVPVVL